MKSKSIDVAIIGSGPYGLSLAAYLHKKKVDVAIFGKPMGTWRHQMPSSMCLKSEGFASNLYHPDGLFTLEDFCGANGIEYAHKGVPVRLTTFSAYGLAFQRQFVPFLNDNLVVDLKRDASGFHLTLENGDTVDARRVVIAAGISHFKYLPPVLAELPSRFVSHSSSYHSLEHFKERDVVVVGAGSSAIDVAVTLHDAGARPQLISRRSSIPFHGKAPLKRPLMTRIKAPWSGLGPSWRSRIACDFPWVFHLMPLEFRSKVVRKHLGPAAGWFTRDKIVNHVPLHMNTSLVGAEVRDEKVHLQLRDANNVCKELIADHVIAGTGYKMDIRRLPFLSGDLFNEIQLEESSPRSLEEFRKLGSGPLLHRNGCRT